MSGYDEFGRDDHLGDPSDPGAEPEPAVTTAQGDMTVIREALALIPEGHVLTHHEALAALDQLAAVPEMAERERDEWERRAGIWEKRHAVVEAEARRHASRAERAEQEIAYTRDRGDSMVYHHEREAFNEWLREGKR